MILKTLLPFLARCVLFAPDVSAHGDINVQIHLINPQIKKSPSVELYVKRDDLYRLDGDCVAALAGDSTYFFVTYPTSAKPTCVWVLGDPNIGGSVQSNVRNA